MKKYDGEYYRRWYRDPCTRIGNAESTLRKAALALSAAEFFLGRRIETVLDVGCGDGLWLAAIETLRPRVRCVGVDPSEYVVRRLGRRHDIRLGTMGELAALKFRKPFDLIVCADVIQYVGNEDLRRGLSEMRRLARHGTITVEIEGNSTAFEQQIPLLDDIGAVRMIAFRSVGYLSRIVASASSLVEQPTK